MNEISPASALPPAASATDWRKLVEKTLKDAPFDSLRRRTVEGLPIEPLYGSRAAAGFPLRALDAERPWDIRTPVRRADLPGARSEILTDLEGGAASVVITLDPSGQAGIAVGSAEGLAQVLEGVLLDLAPLALDAGFLGPRAADWLSAAAKGSPAAPLQFHLDPISAYALSGQSPGPVESHIVSAATVAARLADAHPAATHFLAAGRVVHEAGGGEAGELAFALASALVYAKALVRAGLPIERAFQAVQLGLCADADYFMTLAKLRAARMMWSRMTGACGVSAPARIEVRSSRRMLTVKDPWTNMLRLAAAAFGGAVGGADSVVLDAFTDAIGPPTEFARRQSRNTQLVLMEEAHLGRVADPAAGAGYAEALTDEIARAGWTRFQAIEAAGGLVSALSGGLIAESTAQANADRLAAGAPRIVGVTAFPPIDEARVETAKVQVHTVAAPSTRLPGPDSRCPPLTPIRIAAAHEAAR